MAQVSVTRDLHFPLVPLEKTLKVYWPEAVPCEPDRMTDLTWPPRMLEYIASDLGLGRQVQPLRHNSGHQGPGQGPDDGDHCEWL